MSGDRDHSNIAHDSRDKVSTRDACPANSIASLNGQALLANSGIPLDLNWISEVRVNTSAVERRVQSQVARRTVKKGGYSPARFQTWPFTRSASWWRSRDAPLLVAPSWRRSASTLLKSARWP